MTPTVTITPTVTTTVTAGGPITWAPGFGPNGVVASVQTAPTTKATTTTTTTGGVAAGTQTAPVVARGLSSTSTSGGDSTGMIALGLASLAAGLVLLRAGRPATMTKRLD